MTRLAVERALPVLKRLPAVGWMVERAIVALHRRRFRSASYWEERYRAGGDSGPGSCGALAEFKAEALNSFVREHGIESVVEFGCGDGNQLALAEYPRYTGLDVAPSAVDLCRRRFAHDRNKEFKLWNCVADAPPERADLAISLDVIYHLVENHVFDSYMRCLFGSAGRFVIVYSDNNEGSRAGAHSRRGAPDFHVRHRRFTDWVAIHYPAWRLVRRIPNRYPGPAGRPKESSGSDFFVYAAPGI